LQFHLGTTLLDGERLEPAVAALRIAAELFDVGRTPIEHAKALNMLGAALQHQGALDEAADAFSRAADLFAEHDQPAEHAAALFNQGLVHRRRTAHGEAARCFAEAHQRFEARRLPLQTSAAARELGATRLELGELEAAVEILEQALGLAAEAGERLATGTSANLLGLAHLAARRAESAAEAFTTALDAYPRRLDPAGHAMATANLALAHEQAGDLPRARLAARRARSNPHAADAVRAQAAAVIERLGTEPDDVLTVLDQLPTAAWVAETREELISLLDADRAERREVLGAWIDGQLDRGGKGPDLAAAYLEVVLELPPEEMTTLIDATLAALQDRDDEQRPRFRSQVSRAMARFHLPQWARLEQAFKTAAADIGDDGDWT
jgi:tetratricopeptide (TPR) repeat protein